LNKYRFNTSEKYAVWSYHGKVCYWCGEPLTFAETTIDHVIPEHLLEKEDLFVQAKKEFGLHDDFQINTFMNWLPAHDRCNRSKGTRLPKVTPKLADLLERLYRDAEKIRQICEGLNNQNKNGKLVAQVLAGLENNYFSDDDVRQLKEKLIKEDQNDPVVQDVIGEINYILNPDKWKVAEKKANGFVVLSNGAMGGITNLNPDADISWSCPSCGSRGPWSGARCLTCGRLSDPGD
jgi:hypothetical protein